ncbi:MAG: cupin domain-containing protein [Planctomycetaceae bacterium]
MSVINLKQKLELIDDQWSPHIVARMNDCEFKLAKIEGDFVWHSHAETDEAFLVVKGEFTMEYRDRSVVVKEGELVVVPRGVEHRPRAKSECHILLLEQAGTVNTGEAGGELTAPADKWI